MATKKHVHWLAAFNANQYSALRHALDKRLSLSMGEELVEENTPVDVLIAATPSRHILERCRGASLVVPFAGMPESTKKLLFEFKHMPVHNIHHNAPTVAEMVFAMLLAVSKRLMSSHNSMHDGLYVPGHYDPTNLSTMSLIDKRMLILGYGAVGIEVAKRSKAFGIKVSATRRSLDAPMTTDDNVRVFPSNALHSLLPQTDILVVALPLTEETRNLINAEELAMLHRTSIVINVGRGPSKYFHTTSGGAISESIFV
jgi:phosphoglycerate dehydrogenase-like enzyme